MKLHQDFQITYPLTQKVVRDLKIVTEHLGDLIIEGTAYCDTNYSKIEVDDRYSVDIDYIKFNGTDIKPVIEVSGMIDDVTEFCIVKAASLFEEEVIA